MTQSDWATLSIMATIFMTAGSGAWWLSSCFTKLERLIYKEHTKLRDEIRTTTDDHTTRILQLEIKSFGMTHSGITRFPH